jgi:hypothetical protein
MRSPSLRVLKQSCDIYPATAGQDRGGRFQPSYATSPTYRGVPCTAQPGVYVETFDQGAAIKLREWRLMLGRSVTVKQRDRIVFADPAGITHTVYVEADRDEAGRGAAYSIRCTERT